MLKFLEIKVGFPSARVLTIRSLCLATLILVSVGCQSPEEAAKEHFQKGKELFDKGEIDTAFLEFKSANQSQAGNADTYYYMALVDEKKNNLKSMRQNLSKAIELAPDMIPARLKLGKISLIFGEVDKAREQANYVLQKEPVEIDGQILLASSFIREGKYKEASDIVDSVLKSAPENPEAISLSAALAFERGEVDSVLSLIEKALAIKPENLPLRLLRIKAYSARNDIEKVVAEYESLVTLYPDVDNFKVTLASMYSMTGKLDKAENVLRQIVEASKDKIEPKVVLLEFLNAKAKDRVVSEYSALSRAAKNDQNTVFELSKWMIASGFRDAGVNGLKDVLSVEKNSDLGLAAKTVIAEMALGDKRYDEVDKALTEVLTVKPDFYEAKLLRGRLLLSENKVDDALEFLNKLVWEKKDADSAYQLLGQAYAMKNDRKQADRNLKLALDINPANAAAFFPVYEDYMKAGQRDTARHYLEKAIKAKPNQILFLIAMVEADVSEGRLDEAQEVVQRVALLSKNKAIPLYLQATVMQGKKQFQSAAELYKSVLIESPDHLNSMINLVKVYAAINEPRKAQDFLEDHYSKHLGNIAIASVLSDFYVANNDSAKAKNFINEQLKRFPNAVPLYQSLARIEASLHKDIAIAKDILLRGLEANPDSIQLSMSLGAVYEQLRDFASAKRLYSKLLEKFPDSMMVVNNLAALLIESPNSEEVDKGAQLAERLKDVENTYFKDTYAWSLVKIGKTDLGLQLLGQLVLKEPKMPELRYHLGVAHAKVGNKATAISELKQAIALSEKLGREFAGQSDARKILSELEHK
ncbi:tetratricopeptide repeat protein [Methylomonas sp. CM2]|uniref:tetratricopeptide repeat protein n=1 Tax=Methylomonas sp. CM2 TaxID=3417647 RepID=UPI003CF0C051